MMGFNWDSRAVAAAPIPLDKLPLIENAVTNQCDASDGLLDGLVQDPRACSFEPAVLRCQGARTKGKGNIDDAANFVCAAPKQADDD